VDFLTRAADSLPRSSEKLRELRDVYIALRYQPKPSIQLLSQLRHLVNQLRV
jgi:hypothetical protein